MALITFTATNELPAADLNANFNFVNTIQVITVSLTAANIIAMFTTPITVIAGVAGQVPVIEEAVWSFTVGGTQFTGGGTTKLAEETSGTTLMIGPSASFINAAASAVQTRLPADGITRTSGKGIQVSNNTGAFATGNGTMKLFIAYRMVTL
jgi:hypothetical protein